MHLIMFKSVFIFLIIVLFDINNFISTDILSSDWSLDHNIASRCKFEFNENSSIVHYSVGYPLFLDCTKRYLVDNYETVCKLKMIWLKDEAPLMDDTDLELPYEKATRHTIAATNLDQGNYTCIAFTFGNNLIRKFSVEISEPTFIQKVLFPKRIPSIKSERVPGKLYWLPYMLIRNKIQFNHIVNIQDDVHFIMALYMPHFDKSNVSIIVNCTHSYKQKLEKLPGERNDKYLTNVEKGCNNFQVLDDKLRMSGSCYLVTFLIKRAVLNDRGIYNIQATSVYNREGNQTIISTINIKYSLNFISDEHQMIMFTAHSKVCYDSPFTFICHSDHPFNSLTIYRVDPKDKSVLTKMASSKDQQAAKLNVTTFVNNSHIARVIEPPIVTFTIESITYKDLGVYMCVESDGVTVGKKDIYSNKHRFSNLTLDDYINCPVTFFVWSKLGVLVIFCLVAVGCCTFCAVVMFGYKQRKDPITESNMDPRKTIFLPLPNSRRHKNKFYKFVTWITRGHFPRSTQVPLYFLTRRNRLYKPTNDDHCNGFCYSPTNHDHSNLSHNFIGLSTRDKLLQLFLTPTYNQLNSINSDESSSSSMMTYYNSNNEGNSKDSCDTNNSISTETPLSVTVGYQRYQKKSWKDWIIPRDKLVLGNKIGSGDFGVVFSGVIKEDNDSHNEDKSYETDKFEVAIKTLHSAYTEEDLMNLVREMDIMKNIRSHPNVIGLYGACVNNGHPYLVMELAHNGNLRDFLRSLRSTVTQPLSTTATKNENQRPQNNSNDSGIQQSTTNSSIITNWSSSYFSSNLTNQPNQMYALNVTQLFTFSWEIAKGMEYLASQKIIHRDLAARNILVDSKLHMKISDFGLTRAVQNYYRKSTNGRLPIKWMAIESLADRIYTEKSDVWSYGIVLWEIFSYGQTPYCDTDVGGLLPALRNGLRNSQPINCPDSMYTLMIQTWLDEPNERPNFREISGTLMEIIESNHIQQSPNSHTESQIQTAFIPRQYLEINNITSIDQNAPISSNDSHHSNYHNMDNDDAISC